MKRAVSEEVPTLRSRFVEGAWVLALAGLATVGLMTLYRSPTLLLTLLLLLNGVAVLRWHRRQDLAHLVVGALFGNFAELICDFGGVWVHANRDFLGVAPYYIFACYPVLAMAFARLVAAAGGEESTPLARPGSVAAAAGTLLVVLVALSYCFGRDNRAETVVTIVCLLIAAVRFHSRRDRITLGIGAFLGLVWELPCTLFGAWHFPDPQLWGLIPAWLPLAYAVFHLTLLRLGDAAAGWVFARASDPAAVFSPAQS